MRLLTVMLESLESNVFYCLVRSRMASINVCELDGNGLVCLHAPLLQLVNECSQMVSFLESGPNVVPSSRCWTDNVAEGKGLCYRCRQSGKGCHPC